MTGTQHLPRVRECREYEYVAVERDEILTTEGTLDVAPAVQAINAFVIDFKGSRLRLQAGGFVGVLPINDRLILRIRPRTPMANLTRMVERSGYSALAIDALRTFATSAPLTEWVLDIYADALIRHCTEVVNRGLYRTYQRQIDAGSRPRGHLEVSATVRRFASRGISTKAEFSWFERTLDNALNRCLKTALLTLHHRYNGPRRGLPASQQRVRSLASLLPVFDDVATDPHRLFLHDPAVAGLTMPPASRSYYREPLRLASAILSDRGLSLDDTGADVELPSMLLNMGELFEEYVRTTLQRNAADEGWQFRVLDGNEAGHRPLYVSPRPPITLAGETFPAVIDAIANPPKVTPDIVFERRDGYVPLVAELKNTLMTGIPGRSEVEQAVTYAARYETSRVLLVHPKADKVTGGLHFVGNVGAVSVFDYRYDLAAADLDAEDARFADQVELLLSATD